MEKEKQQNENYIFLQEIESNNLYVIHSFSNTEETPPPQPLNPLKLCKWPYENINGLTVQNYGKMSPDHKIIRQKNYCKNN